MQSHLLGKIELADVKKKKTVKKYNISSDEKNISMAETFMSNFCDMGLSEDEKQLLTQENRCELIHYRNITPEEIQYYVQQLLSNINSNHSEVIAIKASGFGAYVCLAALTFQELPKNKQYQISLEGIPLMLYPKNLIKSKKATHNVEISYTIEEKSWLNSFASLTSAPDHLNQINQFTDLRLTKKRVRLVA
jgi:hypothetical protein